jgi:glycerol-3-phosphate acyltransferase PlsY
MVALLFIAGSSYLLGSIPFGYLLIHIFRGEDVRQSGSGNIGATNVSRKSPVLGLLTLFLDALKGSAAVALGIILSPPILERIPVAYIPWRLILPMSLSPDFAIWTASAVLFVLLGHMFPIWLKFRGGKGVATGLGSFVLIAPKTVLIVALVFITIVLVSRYVSLGSIAAVVLLPVLIALTGEAGVTPLALGLISLASLLIVARHHENVRRLLAGTESRIGAKPA